MIGALLLVTDLLFGGPVDVIAAVGAALACLVLWCLTPLRRRRSLAQ